MNARIAWCLALCCIAAPVAAAPDPAAVAAARKHLQSGVDHGKAEGVLAARGELDVLAASDPDVAELHYWTAFADWRAIPLLGQAKKPDLAKAASRHGLEAIGKALHLRPDWGEALALKAGLLGISLTQGEGDMISIAAEMEALYARARKLSPASPRVLLLEGMNTLHKPEFAGGGAAPALPQLRAAIAAADAENVTDALAPDWGADDARLWAGRAALQLGDPKEAKALFEAALAKNPDNGWVRTRLIPEAEQAMAAKVRP